MFDQLPYDRGDEPLWHPVSSLLFVAVLDRKSPIAEEAHAILHDLGDHAALPYDAVERAIKAASMVDAHTIDLASLHRRLGAAVAEVGLPTTEIQSRDGGTVRELLLMHALLGGGGHVALARWKFGRA